MDRMSEEEIERCEFWVNANRIVHETGVSNHKSARIQVNYEWNLDKLDEWLNDYEDRELLQYLRYGWPLNAKDMEINQSRPINQAGACENAEKVWEYLASELKNGSIIGPFTKNPFGKHARFSPLDTRPKKDSDELRVILNLSYPFEGGSVNNSVDKDVFDDVICMNLRYPSVDDLARIVQNKAKNNKKVRIFKRDLSKAYRQLWMSPESVHLLGYWFENRLYFDVTLSMGSRSAAYCCQRMTNAITHVFGKQGFEDVNYLDDLRTAEEDDHAEEAYDCLGWILDTIGICESKHKACPPAYIAIFLGILFNTLSMTLQIMEERLQEILDLLMQWTNKETATLKEMQSLLRKLNFAGSTVCSGRVFVSRLINNLKQFPPNGRRRINKEIKKDIEWWLQFMEEFDGISIMPPINWNSLDSVISSDACLMGGRGWSCDSEAFQFCFPRWLTDREDVYINELELITIIVAIKVWFNQVKNKNILAYCDNAVSVEVVNSG